MKITLLKENLHTGVGLVSRFAAQKAQLPVLSHLVIEAKDGKVSLSATDLQQGVKLTVAGKVEREGMVAVPAKVMADLAQSLPLGAVELALEEGVMHVRGGAMKAHLQTMTVDDFPEVAFDEDEAEFLEQYTAHDWEEMYGKLGFSISKDESRPVLTGVYWEVSKGKLAATDGYRLSVLRGDLKSKAKLEKSGLLLQGGLLAELSKVVGDLTLNEVRVYYVPQSEQVAFEAEELLLMGRLIEGDYPDYTAIMPKDFGVELELDVAEFLRAVRAAAIFAQDSAQIVRLGLKGREMTVTANTPQVGGNEVIVELPENIEGERKIAFNSRYLIDYLSHLDEERVMFGMSEPLSPGMFWVKGERDYKHVIMPVRVKE